MGFVWLNLQFLCHGRQTFSGVRVAQSLVFCVMVGRHLVGFVWLNLQFCVMVGRFLVGFVWLNLLFSVSWLVDFQWGSCGSIVSFLCHGRQILSGVRVAQSSFLCHGWQTFSGVRVAQSLGFCVMVGRLLARLVWLNLQFSVSWLVDFQWGSCGSIFSFVSWLVYFQWGSCGSIFSFLSHGREIFNWVHVAQSSFLCHGWQTFSGVRVAQSFVFCVMVGRLLVGFVWLNRQFSVSWQVDFLGGSCGSIQFSVSWLVDFQWGSCGSISRFLCHGRQTFSEARVAQSLVFCVMVGRFCLGFVWLNLVFCVMVGRLLVGFVWLNLQVSVSWQVDFQRGSCGSIFSFLCHGWQTFSGVRVAQSLVLCHGWYIFSGVRVAQSLVFCLMVGRFLIGFMWLNLIFCVMVGRLLAGFVWLNLQFSVSWQVDFQWGQCVSIQFSVSWLVDFQGGSCGSIFRFLCHGRQTFSGVRVAQSLVFCVMVGRILVGFVWLNLQFCVMGGRRLVGFVWLNL